MSNKTVAKLFEDAGDMSIAHMARLRDLPIQHIQADEIHSFVGVKGKHLSEASAPVAGAGTVWAFLAVCAESKLIFDYHLGDRGLPDATRFAKSMVGKLKRTERGELAVRPLIVTDGHRPYYEAFEAAIGSDADRAVLIKRYSKVDTNGDPLPSSRYIGSDRIVVVGNPAIVDIHTSYIERQNLNLRMGNRRYNRRTNAFSKTRLNHQRHLALWILYHNFCWMPRPMRPRRDAAGSRSTQWEKRLPAAIASGLEDRLWEVDDLLRLTDEFADQRGYVDVQEEAAALLPLPEGLPTYWVYHNDIKQTTKVHTAACSNCRGGHGKRGSRSMGKWLPFYSLEAAMDGSQEVEPDRGSICSMCLGSYRKLGKRL